MSQFQYSKLLHKRALQSIPRLFFGMNLKILRNSVGETAPTRHNLDHQL